MSNSNSSSSGGIGFFGLLAIVFIALKLTGVIDWSWWLVLLPAYGGLALFLIVVVISYCFLALLEARKQNGYSKRR